MRELLLKLDSYPDPTADWVIAYAGTLAVQLGARLSAAICKVHFAVSGHWLADALVHVDDVLIGENARGEANARLLADRFTRMTSAPNLGGRQEFSGTYMQMPHGLLSAIRLYDLIILQAGNAAVTGQVVEDIVFESGRPILVLPQQPFQRTPQQIVVAWDGSRAAARALADALPLLTKARTVTVATIGGEAGKNPTDTLPLLEQHLKNHDIDATFITRDAGADDAAAALFGICDEVEADLLVAGAYGHSKVREFWLGGVTRSILAHPQIPTLVSH